MRAPAVTAPGQQQQSDWPTRRLPWQVLCDPYQRQLHDLSMNPAAGPMARDLGSEESRQARCVDHCQLQLCMPRPHMSSSCCCSEDSISAEAWADTWLGQVVDARSGPLPVPRTQVRRVSPGDSQELETDAYHPVTQRRSQFSHSSSPAVTWTRWKLWHSSCAATFAQPYGTPT